MIGYRFTIFLREEGDFQPFDGKGNFKVAYEGRIATDDPLEDLFEKFNLDHPADYTGRSLSIGDLVLLEVDGRGYFYACEGTGWKFLTAGVPEAVSIG